ncbi:hypothetical protein GCM10027161_81030 [Microbispora hainanensis]
MVAERLLVDLPEMLAHRLVQSLDDVRPGARLDVGAITRERAQVEGEEGVGEAVAVRHGLQDGRRIFAGLRLRGQHELAFGEQRRPGRPARRSRFCSIVSSCLHQLR